MSFFRWLAFLWRTRNCPHLRTRPVHGDEIRFSGYKHRRCLDCGKYLDKETP